MLAFLYGVGIVSVAVLAVMYVGARLKEPPRTKHKEAIQAGLALLAALAFALLVWPKARLIFEALKDLWRFMEAPQPYYSGIQWAILLCVVIIARRLYQIPVNARWKIMDAALLLAGLWFVIMETIDSMFFHSLMAGTGIVCLVYIALRWSEFSAANHVLPKYLEERCEEHALSLECRPPAEETAMVYYEGRTTEVTCNFIIDGCPVEHYFIPLNRAIIRMRWRKGHWEAIMPFDRLLQLLQHEGEWLDDRGFMRDPRKVIDRFEGNSNPRPSGVRSGKKTKSDTPSNSPDNPST